MSTSASPSTSASTSASTSRHSSVMAETHPYLSGTSHWPKLTSKDKPKHTVRVDNLTRQATSRSVKNCLSVYGTIESCQLFKNQSESVHAFVTFRKVEDATKALSDVKERKLYHRKLRLNAAQDHYQPDIIERFGFIDNEWNSKFAKETVEDESVSEQSEIVHINKLSDDCFRHIFQFLPIADKFVAAKVCKRWEVVNEYPWNTMNTLDFSSSTWGLPMDEIRYIRVNTLRKILRKCGRFLTKINVSDINYDNTGRHLIDMVGESCPNLTNIILDNRWISKSDIDTLAKKCKNITKISLISIVLPLEYDLDDCLKCLFELHKNLEHFEICDCLLTGKCLAYLPRQKIHTNVFRKMNNLQENYIIEALKAFENLENLEIEECSFVTDDTLEIIREHCKNLRSLKLIGDFLQLRTMDTLYPVHPANLIKLQDLSVESNHLASNEFLRNMVTLCPELVSLDITDCPQVTDSAISAIKELHPNISITRRNTPNVS